MAVRADGDDVILAIRTAVSNASQVMGFQIWVTITV